MGWFTLVNKEEEEKKESPGRKKLKNKKKLSFYSLTHKINKLAIMI